MSNDGIVDRGNGRKRMTICNELHRGSKFALIRKDADLPLVLYGMNGSKPMNASYSTTPIGERLTDVLNVNRLRAGITKAVIKGGLLPYIKGLYKHLSGMKGNFHVPFLEEGERVIALPYSTTTANIIRLNDVGGF